MSIRKKYHLVLAAVAAFSVLLLSIAVHLNNPYFAVAIIPSLFALGVYGNVLTYPSCGERVMYEQKGMYWGKPKKFDKHCSHCGHKF